MELCNIGPGNPASPPAITTLRNEKFKTMSTLLIIAFICSGVSLVFLLLTYVLHRRSRTPYPAYAIGAMLWNLGLALCFFVTATFVEGSFAMLLVCCGLLLSGWGAVLVFRARRQMRHGGRSLQ